MNSYRLFLLPVLFLALISMEAFAQDSTGLQTRLENCHQRLESLYAAGAPAQQIDSARRCVSRLHKRLIKSGQGQMLWVRQRVQAALDGAADGTMAWELEPRAAVRAKTPSRKQMNKIVREFLGSSFEGESCIKNCAQIRGNMKSGTQKCKGGGTVTVKVSRCSPNGNVAFWLRFNRCRSGGKVASGNASLTFAVQNPWLGTRMISSGFYRNGFKMSTKGVYVYNQCINGKYGPNICKGSFSSGSRRCKVTRDCKRCRF